MKAVNDMKELLTIGLIGKSRKENEKRVPIHPEHIKYLPAEVRKYLFFEKGYGEPFGVGDEYIAGISAGRVASRDEILNDFDCVLLPKPVLDDLRHIKKGTIVWGWPHCVQQREITQISIERKFTLIAWENMFSWNQDGSRILHTFHKNNELAGYAGVNHALSLVGINGNYGKTSKAVVLSFGSASRGSVYALQGQGFRDITVFTNRPTSEVRDQLPGISYKQMKSDDSGIMHSVHEDGTLVPFAEELSDVQIILNGTLQDTDHPKMFIPEQHAGLLMPGTLIVDISCDDNMGFWCAKPTTFKDPIINTKGIHYYAVDHSPSYYWNTASWEISKALIPFVPLVVQGPAAWQKSKTIMKAIEIDQGVIRNPKILSFQNRSEKYPHAILPE